MDACRTLFTCPDGKTPVVIFRWRSAWRSPHSRPKFPRSDCEQSPLLLTVCLIFCLSPSVSDHYPSLNRAYGLENWSPEVAFRQGCVCWGSPVWLDHGGGLLDYAWESCSRGFGTQLLLFWFRTMSMWEGQGYSSDQVLAFSNWLQPFCLFTGTRGWYSAGDVTRHPANVVTQCQCLKIKRIFLYVMVLQNCIKVSCHT